MSTLTPHLQLTKPDMNENVSPKDFNQNFDVIDEEVHELKTDYVVAQGIQKGWGYRRWSSGIAECWCLHEQKTRNDYGVGHTFCTVGNYPVIFVSKPVITATFGIDGKPQGSIAHCESSTTSPNISANNSGSGINVNCWFNIYAIGRWKE